MDIGFVTDGGPPGFADWDAPGISTVPDTPTASRLCPSAAGSLATIPIPLSSVPHWRSWQS